MKYYCFAGIVSSFMSLSASWGFGVPLSPSLFILVLFLLAFPKRKKALSQNALGKIQKEEHKKPKERGKESKKERRKKVEKKHKNEEIEARNDSSTTIIYKIWSEMEQETIKNIWESIFDRIGSCIEVEGKLTNY